MQRDCPLQVVWTGEARGYGAVAAVDIEEGACLGCYEGELLTEAEFWQRYPSGIVRPKAAVDRESITICSTLSLLLACSPLFQRRIVLCSLIMPWPSTASGPWMLASVLPTLHALAPAT